MPFNVTDITTFITTPVLLIIAILFGIVSVIMSAVLLYHWNRFGFNSKVIVFVEVLYLLVLVSLLVIVVASAFLF